ncbi:hypothetical protein RJ639_015227 [Escallonia herrerae]|uniref:Retrotransposon Copia-like N-terminal domain-containing protein n=1 Tax=Escallonia herrerae TaxID=1293975 RepID=A0AA89AN52_9ASTE|nr:hypothetical protein RJ639_015227 [Escallonia herrerae]
MQFKKSEYKIGIKWKVRFLHTKHLQPNIYVTSPLHPPQLTDSATSLPLQWKVSGGEGEVVVVVRAVRGRGLAVVGYFCVVGVLGRPGGEVVIVMEDESASYVHGGLAPVANVQNIAIDTKSPFYLHPSDHPGLIFVTQPLSENGENYFTWRRNMLTALQSKNKAGFVDGLIAKPDVRSRDFQSWIQCNAVVKSWIVNSLSRELQTGAAHADTASEIWCDFDERFTQGIALRVYDLKRSIALLQQEKSAISTYYGKLKGVWNELHNLRPIPVCTCGAGKKMQEMREEEKVFDFLMGLDDTYKTV